MGHSVSNGGGQISQGYLFGSDKPVKLVPAHTKPVQNPKPLVSESPQKPNPISSKSPKNGSEVPASVHGSNTNNYLRVEGQNCGNFIMDRPSTKFHVAPSGGSSLGYLFGAPPMAMASVNSLLILFLALIGLVIQMHVEFVDIGASEKVGIAMQHVEKDAKKLLIKTYI